MTPVMPRQRRYNGKLFRVRYVVESKPFRRWADTPIRTRWGVVDRFSGNVVWHSSTRDDARIKARQLNTQTSEERL